MNAQEHIDELQKLKDETTKLATELKWTKEQLEYRNNNSNIDQFEIDALC